MAVKVGVKKSKYTNVYLLLGVGVVLISLVNTLQVSSFNSEVTGMISQAAENARPAEVQLITLTANSCPDCFDISRVVSDIESTGVNVTQSKTLDFKSPEGEQVIKDYGVEKLPSIIITGELDKATKLKSKLASSVKEFNHALVFSNPLPPFIDYASGMVKGEVSVIQLKNNACTTCSTLDSLVSQLSASGVKVKSNRVVSFDSGEGSSLISKYNITSLPALVLDGEAKVYPSFEQTWLQLGSAEKDGYYVSRSAAPPFYDLSTNRIRGLVNLTVLNCDSGCYDAESVHLPILRNYGLSIGSVSVYNYSQSQAKVLIQKYNVTKIPAFILEGDVGLYSGLVQVWPQVGTVESDGAYIFRQAQVVSQSGTDFKDLTNITQ